LYVQIFLLNTMNFYFELRFLKLLTDQIFFLTQFYSRDKIIVHKLPIYVLYLYL